MRAAVLGMLVGLGVLVALTFGFPEASAQRAAPDRATSSDLMALSFDAGDGRQQVTVIDPKSRVMAVYHVDRTTGALTLKSVRNIHWDLQIEDFNSANPTPREIRALTDPRTESR
ncbi:MAG: hypothetical protein L0211_11645 [Planctomycetaceae bacterium]|nr:hypothetical protein [Planctomycetaceae bacterium]